MVIEFMFQNGHQNQKRKRKRTESEPHLSIRNSENPHNNEEHYGMVFLSVSHLDI